MYKGFIVSEMEAMDEFNKFFSHQIWPDTHHYQVPNMIAS